MKNIQAGRGRFATIAMFGLLAGLAPACIGSAVAETAEQRDACTSDAFRLCSSSIPDEGRTKACLIHSRRSLSPLCRAAMSGGGGGRGHHYRRHH